MAAENMVKFRDRIAALDTYWHSIQISRLYIASTDKMDTFRFPLEDYRGFRADCPHPIRT